MVELSIGFAVEMNKSGIACRFIIVDADIENNPTVVEFYKKIGFHINEKIKKNGKTLSMRLDIFNDLPS